MNNKMKWLLMLVIASSLFSCKSDDSEPETTTETPDVFSILGTLDGAYYLAQTENLTSGSLSFVNNGTQLDADQAARIIAVDGFIYSLNYGTGLLTKLQAQEDGSYATIAEINAGLAVGTNRPRFKLANENTIMVYNVAVTPMTDSTGEVIDQTCTLRLASIAIPELSVSNLTEFNIPQTSAAAEGATIGYHPMRVDAPVITGDKIYFGLMHMDMFDPSTPPPFRVPKQSGLETLVFDYPSFSNGKITTSTASAGHTGGYRAPSMYVDENGDVYQSNWYMSGSGFDLTDGDKTVITRLRNGAYDNSYVFNVSEALGLTTNVGTAGWFYVGNGIGYMPIQLEDDGNYYSENSWSVAKVDIYNKTATKLDVPMSSLFAYENGVVSDGKFYMAISPIDGDAFVYEFDPSTETAVKTVTLEDENVTVEGIY